MRNQEFEINSYWKQETGRWSEKDNQFLNRTFSPIEEKKLKVIYEPDENIIKFVGGPTGYESYYFTDIVKTIESHPSRKFDEFCICGGTINRWANCTVKMNDFKEIIFQIKKRKSENTKED
jgi:hypothetical protein